MKRYLSLWLLDRLPINYLNIPSYSITYFFASTSKLTTHHQFWAFIAVSPIKDQIFFHVKKSMSGDYPTDGKVQQSNLLHSFNC